MNLLPHVITIATYFGFALFALLALLLLGSLLPVSNGYQLRVVESGSMEPTIPTGAVVVVRAAETYAVGDVVTFQRRGDAAATTHRIIALEDGDFIMQGDANNVADMTPVRPAEVVGRVMVTVPYVGYVLAFAKQPIGFLILVGLPAGLIVFEQITRIRRAIKTTQTTTS